MKTGIAGTWNTLVKCNSIMNLDTKTILEWQMETGKNPSNILKNYFPSKQNFWLNWSHGNDIMLKYRTWLSSCCSLLSGFRG